MAALLLRAPKASAGRLATSAVLQSRQVPWRVVPLPHALDRRFCVAASGSAASAGHRDAAAAQPVRSEEDDAKWELVVEKWGQFKLLHKLTAEDFERFPREQALFQAEPRLRAESLTANSAGPDELDWWYTFDATVSMLRFADRITEPFTDVLLQDRLEDTNKPLAARFGIHFLEGKDLNKTGLHNLAVPREGAYVKMRMQVYFLTLHTWLIHRTQHRIQASEKLWGSAICALITRRAFEWEWVVVRLWLMIEDVPAMSITSELEDLMEYAFGLCKALDEAFETEAPDGTARALEQVELKEGQIGLLPRVKYCLWANMYSGVVPHDLPELHELTVYLVRQRLAMEAMPRNTFLTGRFNWQDLPLPEERVE
ncbi:unnamed protein product [Polarella glacialis]|uniref:Ubiquinol-cytochrome c chaperone domain-containing protein n=1 Tax=Polarella glacialis TaxID=89957 RepID=A0A813FW19_POLGL|nr:unnamed protein product [Polarella glacialis]CAE8692185.1 unnamed protein product [Polarella glacialis]